MSTMYSGETSLSFIIGIRLCPPESSLASGPSFCSSATASSSVRGEKYSKLRGIMGSSPSYIGFDFALRSTELFNREGHDHTRRSLQRQHWSTDYTDDRVSCGSLGGN